MSVNVGLSKRSIYAQLKVLIKLQGEHIDSTTRATRTTCKNGHLKKRKTHALFIILK